MQSSKWFNFWKLCKSDSSDWVQFLAINPNLLLHFPSVDSVLWFMPFFFFSFQRLSMCRLGLGFQLVHRCSIHHVASSINNKDWLFCNCSSASYGACWCWGPLQTYNGKIITRYGQCNMHRWLSTVPPPPGNLLKLTGRMILLVIETNVTGLSL